MIIVELKDYEWIWIVDADGFIIDNSYDVRHIIEKYKEEKTFMIFSVDFFNVKNTGVVAFQANSISLSYAKEWYNRRDLNNHPWWVNSLLFLIFTCIFNFLFHISHFS